MSCPNKYCPNFKKTNQIKKDGFYKRKNDSKVLQRYKCKICNRKFSAATFSLAKNQNKRRVNETIRRLLSSGTSQRRIAKIVGVHRKTVSRKFEYLSKVSKKKNLKFIKSLSKNPIRNVQFDDLITIDHTKLKPLSISIAVCKNTRCILGLEVSKIPAFGHLAEKSRRKYGYRPSHHIKGLRRLFEKISPAISPYAVIESDEHTNYPKVVKDFLPEAIHKTYKGGRGCIVGQGELKKLHFDPLFSLNHTCAMLRYGINRLIRKTWSTTKCPVMLMQHLEIYMHYHNTSLVNIAPS